MGLSENPVQVNTDSAGATGRELRNRYPVTDWTAPYLASEQLFGSIRTVEYTDGNTGGIAGDTASDRAAYCCNGTLRLLQLHLSAFPHLLCL